MLKITVPARKEWDESIEKFVIYDAINFSMEHSLISISKWESKWHKSFLLEEEKTVEESLDYIRCAAIDKDLTYDEITSLPEDVINSINSYIEDPMSATTFQDNRPESAKRGLKKKEIVTSEQIYYWMIAYNIPFECEKWHLNRLMNLIKICSIENDKQNPKSSNKMSKKDIYAHNRALNEARKKKWNTKG